MKRAAGRRGRGEQQAAAGIGGRGGQQAAARRGGRGEQQAAFLEVEDEIHSEEDVEDVSEEEEDEGDCDENYETEDDEDETPGLEIIKVSHVPTNGSMVLIRDLRSWLKSPYVEV